MREAVPKELSGKPSPNDRDRFIRQHWAADGKTDAMIVGQVHVVGHLAQLCANAGSEGPSLRKRTVRNGNMGQIQAIPVGNG